MLKRFLFIQGTLRPAATTSLPRTAVVVTVQLPTRPQGILGTTSGLPLPVSTVAARTETAASSALRVTSRGGTLSITADSSRILWLPHVVCVLVRAMLHYISLIATCLQIEQLHANRSSQL